MYIVCISRAPNPRFRHVRTFLEVLSNRHIFYSWGRWIHVWTYHNLFILHLWMDVWVLCSLGLWQMTWWASVCKSCVDTLSLSLGKYLWVAWLGHRVVTLLISYKTAKLFSEWLYSTSPRAVNELSGCHTSSSALGVVSRHNFIPSKWCIVLLWF